MPYAMITAHRVRGHEVVKYMVHDNERPWRWQCSCGELFGGPPSEPVTPVEPISVITEEGTEEVMKTLTDIIEVVQEKAPTEDDLEDTIPGVPTSQRKTEIKEYEE